MVFPKVYKIMFRQDDVNPPDPLVSRLFRLQLTLLSGIRKKIVSYCNKSTE